VQHYQRNTVGIMRWCPTCGRKTLHDVADRRVGSCREPHVAGMSKAQEKRALGKSKKEGQGDLFGEV
jgi:hypothetical protein